MNFQPKEFCYNPKTKVFSEIGGSSSLANQYEKMVKRYAEAFGYKMTSITFKTYEANFSLEKK